MGSAGESSCFPGAAGMSDGASPARDGSDEDSPGPSQGGQGDTGVLGCLQAGRGQDAAGPEPLWSCSSPAQISAPLLPVGPFLDRASHHCGGQMFLSSGCATGFGAGAGTALRACWQGTISFSIPATSTAALLLIFFSTGELKRGRQLVTLPDSHLPVT